MFGMNLNEHFKTLCGGFERYRFAVYVIQLKQMLLDIGHRQSNKNLMFPLALKIIFQISYFTCIELPLTVCNILVALL